VNRDPRMFVAVQFVLLPKKHSSDRALFDNAAKALCPPRETCQVMFWTDRKYVPSRTPFTDAQLSQLAAQYNQNANTGYARLLLPCRVDPRPERCSK
jgi:hypothetical protein